MTMQVLVATASKHGATSEIAAEIARVLARRGFVVVDKPADEVDDIERFDACVIGSAVYMGRWLPAALALCTRHAEALGARPVWLFSSGPIGDPPQPETDPQGIAEMVERTAARGHRVFAGRLNPERLGLSEKVIAGMLRAPKGDFRDFAAITAWAEQIANQLDRPRDAFDATREALLTAAAH